MSWKLKSLLSSWPTTTTLAWAVQSKPHTMVLVLALLLLYILYVIITFICCWESFRMPHSKLKQLNWFKLLQREINSKRYTDRHSDIQTDTHTYHNWYMYYKVQLHFVSLIFLKQPHRRYKLLRMKMHSAVCVVFGVVSFLNVSNFSKRFICRVR